MSACNLTTLIGVLAVMNQDTDQLIIDKVLDGDSNAYRVLIDKYRDLVFTVVIRIVKSREEAEEVAQDTFIKAYQSLKDFKGASKFSTWLYSIAYRKALDRVRKMRRVSKVELHDDRTDYDVGHMENALGHMMAEERKKAVRQCLEKLPEKDAAIVTFFYFEELSIKEIATLTNLTEDNIKVKLHRSRKKMFSMLEHFIRPEISNSNGRAV